jgi:peptide chain release factor 3
VCRLDAADQPLSVTGHDDPALKAILPPLEADAICDQLELARGALKPFDKQAFLEGHLTPVLFGSALRTFGVADLIDALAEFAPPPRGLEAASRHVDPREPKMSGFVFKIQANMDPNHRDRIAFMRVCSGKLSRGMKAKLVRTGKNMALNAPQFCFAQDRQLADEAYPGDVVGIPNHGTLRIGDTLTEGEDLVFRGVPSFAPEILRRVKISDAMRAKKLREALQQMAEEGVVQLFLPNDGSNAMVGVVGALQLDVLIERLAAEYGLQVTLETSRFELARWVTSEDPAELEKFARAYPSSMAVDLDGAPVYLAASAWDLRYEQEKWPQITFADIKDYQKAETGKGRQKALV